jgi:hypothetical protein
LRPERARRYIENLDPEFNRAVERTFRRFQSQGQLRKMPMGQLHRVMVCAIFGYAITRLVIWPDRKWDDEAEIATTVDVLVSGLAVCPPGPSDERRRRVALVTELAFAVA